MKRMQAMRVSVTSSSEIHVLFTLCYPVPIRETRVYGRMRETDHCSSGEIKKVECLIERERSSSAVALLVPLIPYCRVVLFAHSQDPRIRISCLEWV